MSDYRMDLDDIRVAPLDVLILRVCQRYECVEYFGGLVKEHTYGCRSLRAAILSLFEEALRH